MTLAYGAVLLSLASVLAALFADRYPTAARVAFTLLGLGGLAAVAAGGAALLGHEVERATLPLGLPWQPWQLRLDPLTGLFLAIIGAVVAAVAVYGPAYAREFRHGRSSFAVLGGFTGLFVAGMQLVVLADEAFTFMVAWELMSLSSYFLVAYQHEQAANRRAAFLYLLMAHIGGLSILLAFAVLAAHGGSFSFEAMRQVALTPNWATVAFALAFLGFGMKAGLVPLHAWLPEAHPAAPSHISALMSGVMLKVAVYGFVRFSFDLLGEPQWGWGVAVLAVGGASAMLGVLLALMQSDLKRLLAYSSVENVGIIFVALGLALLFLGSGATRLGALGLMAALYHAVNHALFKSLLFLGAGAVLHTSHERNLENLGGLLRRMPWTGLFFLLGCVSISSLPPFNGFVSEWLTFQTALQAWTLQSGVLRIMVPVGAATLALTGALGAACFVRAYGVGFLGQARSRQARHAREVSLGMRLAQGALAVACLVLGVLPTGMVELLNGIPQGLLGQGLTEATVHGWLWLTPIEARTASYSGPLVLVGLSAAWLLGAWVLRRGGVRRVQPCEPWDCGYARPDPRMQYTGAAFSQPLRRVFGMALSVAQVVDRRDGLRYRLQVGDRVWGLLYEPVGRMVKGAARRVARLQSGNIRIYLGWSLGTLLVLLWLIS